jgi:hypothetical protein
VVHAQLLPPPHVVVAPAVGQVDHQAAAGCGRALRGGRQPRQHRVRHGLGLVHREPVLWRHVAVKLGVERDLHGDEAPHGRAHARALPPAHGDARGVQLLVQDVVKRGLRHQGLRAATGGRAGGGAAVVGNSRLAAPWQGRRRAGGAHLDRGCVHILPLGGVVVLLGRAGRGALGSHLMCDRAIGELISPVGGSPRVHCVPRNLAIDRFIVYARDVNVGSEKARYCRARYCWRPAAKRPAAELSNKSYGKTERERTLHHWHSACCVALYIRPGSPLHATEITELPP